MTTPPNQPEYKCSHCGYVLSDIQNLGLHMQQEHGAAQSEDAWLSDLLFNFSWDTHLVKVQNHSLRLSDEESTAKYTELYKGVEAAIREHERQAVQAAYDRGYNTGWIKSKRSHTPSKLISAAKQLEIIATNLRQTATTQPPAADTTKQGEGE